MLKWHELSTTYANAGQYTIIKSFDSDPENHGIAKKILGLVSDTKLLNFHFAFSIFGALSECSFGSAFQYDDRLVRLILASSEAQPISIAFDDSSQKSDLLNLFDREDDEKPTLLMLIDFIKLNKKNFHTSGVIGDEFWIGKWSNVNNWAVFWRSTDTFNCLAKMSG